MEGWAERLDSADWKKEERMMVMVMRMRRPILTGRKLITTQEAASRAYRRIEGKRR